MPVSQHQIQLWRAEFHRELTTQGLTATPQAVAAVMEMLKRTPVELSGDSDALLVGLLYAGSYTVDVLESAGVTDVLASAACTTRSSASLGMRENCGTSALTTLA